MPYSPDEFEAKLWELMKSKRNGDEAAFLKAGLDQEQLQKWVKHTYVSIREFTTYLANIHAKCPHFDARKEIAQNMYDEHGHFQPEKDHSSLWRKLGRAVGVSDQDMEAFFWDHIADPRYFPLHRVLSDITLNRSFVEGLAAVCFAIEAGTPETFRQWIPVLRERYGLSDDALEFIHLHIGADEVHSRRGIDVIKNYATTDEMQAKALKAAEEVLNLTGPAAYRRAETRAG